MNSSGQVQTDVSCGEESTDLNTVTDKGMSNDIKQNTAWPLPSAAPVAACVWPATHLTTAAVAACVWSATHLTSAATVAACLTSNAFDFCRSSGGFCLNRNAWLLTLQWRLVTRKAFDFYRSSGGLCLTRNALDFCRSSGGLCLIRNAFDFCRSSGGFRLTRNAFHFCRSSGGLCLTRNAFDFFSSGGLTDPEDICQQAGSPKQNVMYQLPPYGFAPVRKPL